MISVFEYLLELEKEDDSHLGRILVLLNVFAGIEGKKEIKGLTKLAKLDFLLRYPVYLERAMKKVHQNPERVKIKEYEKKNVESKMVRFKYGPWDFRYRRFINELVGRGLVYIRPEGRSIYLGVTDNGRKIFEALQNDPWHDDIISRAKIINSNFNKSGTNLMKFIYATFPEIGSLKYGTKI
ncbi:hypothetical protein [Flagellimonas algicola]|uniref:Winged helix DNA-binding protein n=1 Tax=Flagellimonas algicola TaxID=2583815 RepID=A0ABY2WSE7_9FLAO|nr:hypothetical protein [Allomuricauda algicola]TMU57444.1 hypothetical protein FGG15_07845 [Allomuricauda algicola]